MPMPGRYRETNYLTTNDHYDVIGNQESVLRVAGTAAGATVTNLGPTAVENAVAVAPDAAYGAITSVAVGATQAVAASVIRDFWAVGGGRSRLQITRP